MPNTIPRRCHLSYAAAAGIKIFSPFVMNDYLESIDHEFDSDPDTNFFNEYCHNFPIESCYYLESDFDKYTSTILNSDNEFLSFIHVNIRSIRANGSDFYSYLETLRLKFSCIALTETWLKNDMDQTFSFPGYKSINRTRKNSHGGGVSILIKEGISYKIKENLCFINRDIECIFIEARLSKRVLIGVIYRPPDRNIKDFNSQLRIILDTVSDLHIPCYLLGDTNINLLNHSTHSETGNYIDLLYSYSFVPLINRPTRVTDHSATLIDHIFTNNLSPNILKFQGILLTDITDHYPIFHIAQLPDKSKQTSEYYFKRKMTDTNYSEFKNLISNYDWSKITGTNNCANAFSDFYNTLKTFFNRAFPICRVKKAYRNRLPWLTDSLKK